ncbi:MAG: T9SS type A sorting domain-containing protein, partial [Saprospiraceae bacterium]|nr:T9SS type A sorting domain-containing protein [Saprospiraceae bacterium]
AGSASGGLWMTETAGEGPGAWQEVETGFPVQAVSCIVINQENPQTMFIGTGEVYGSFDNTEPGIVSRVTRGFYGLGIFKTTDGGASWTHVLNWALDDLKGVQDLAIDPLDSNLVYAATTGGLMRTSDGGINWELIVSMPMAMDVEILPGDPHKIFVTFGDLNFNNNTIPSGIFVSVDHGTSFQKVTNGLPAAYSGKAMLAASPSDPDVMFASVQHWSTSFQDSTTSLGLFKSTDRGSNWQRINNTNVARWQGWFSHDVAVHPEDPQQLMYVGVDSWRSTDGGETVDQVSDWRLWTFGLLPNSGPDGPADYVHGDIHAAYYHPLHPDHVYLATDGGVFVSEDGGLTYESRNGGLHTTQFYAQAGSSATDPILFIGGTQDNASYIRRAKDTWWRVIGGDGMSAYIDPTDNNVMYGSAQGLVIARLDLLADTLTVISPPLQQGESVTFNAPYVLAPSAPSTIYAAGQHLYRSTDRGDNWTRRSLDVIDGSNPVIHLAVDPHDPAVIYASTASNPFAPGLPNSGVFKSVDGGISWVAADAGLPRRLIKEVAIDPDNTDILYAAVSGFGSAHVFRSDDGGMSWYEQDSGLPDVPTNTIALDPLVTTDIYVGNDVGIYYSDNGGATWRPWMEGLPRAILVTDLSIAPSARMLRAVTHGRGIFERDLENSEVSAAINPLPFHFDAEVIPNPLHDQGVLSITTEEAVSARFEIVDIRGRVVYRAPAWHLDAGTCRIDLAGPLATLSSATYFLQIYSDKRPVLTRKLIVTE